MTKIRVTNRKTSTSAYTEQEGNDNVSSRTRSATATATTHRPLLKSSNSSNDDYIDSQFQKPPVRVPTRSIALATFLCCAGSLLLSLGFLVITGHLDAKFADRVWPMIIMGFLMFIPGSYHVRIAYYAYQGIPGFSFEDIPEFE